MRKAVLPAVILSILLTVSAVSADITFNSTVRDLETNASFGAIGGGNLNLTGMSLKAQYNNNSWIIGFTDIEGTGNSPRNYLSTYDLEFARLQGALSIYSGLGGFLPFRGWDWQIINQTHILTRVMNQDPLCDVKQMNISQSNLGSRGAVDTLYQDNPGSCGFRFLRVTTDWDWLFPQLNFAHVTNDTGTDWFFYVGGTSDSSLFTPAADEINNPFLFYNPTWNVYDLFYDNNDQIRVAHYDSGFGFLGVETLIDLADPINETNVLKTTNGIYVTSIINGSAFQISLFHSSSATDYVLVEEQTVNTANGNQTHNVREPYLAFDFDREQKILFYVIVNQTKYPKSIHYLEEIIACTCSDWYNTTDCIGSNRIQLRDCVPNLCAGEQNFVFDAFCNQTQSLIDRNLFQRTEKFSEIQTCQSQQANPSETGSVSCRASLEIDASCTKNIQANATLVTRVTRTGGLIFGGLGNNKYHLLLCNPLYDCFETDPLCESQHNFTQTKDWLNYYAGDTVTAHFEISQAQRCKAVRDWMFDYGWKEYSVSGSIQYSCDRRCGGDTCIRRGVIDYQAEQFPDCSVNETSLIICSNGCGGGACLTQLAQRDVRSPSGEPMTWILGEMTNTFPTVILMLFSVGISAAVGVSISKETGEWRMGLAGVMGMILIFVALGWLPSIIGLMWVLAVALLFAYLISGMRGGG